MALSLRTDNPFVIGYVTSFSDGEQSLDRFRLKYLASKSEKLHTVRTFDTLHHLAYDYYGSSKYWWVIYDVNDLDDPFDLELNSILIIPDLERIKASAL